MCGICGIIQFSDQIDELERIHEMTQLLAHRGPDDQGILIEKNIALGHRRLSIVDLSPNGHQPMISKDKTIALSFNGEIYNYQQLKKTYLSDYRFHSKTDTEVLLNLYHKKGIDIFSLLQGMFAFAIWDKKSNQLILARDQFGEKPLYYYADSSQFLFSSELFSLIKGSKYSPKIRLQSLHNTLSYGHSLPPYTIYENIFQLLPGEYMCIDLSSGKRTTHRYFSPASQTTTQNLEDNKWLEKTLSKSIQEMLTGDVPIGVYLSGGMDSSSIVALLAKNNPNPIQTFTVAYDHPQEDERSFAELVATQYKTNHHPLLLDESIMKHLPKLVSLYGEPFKDSTAIPAYLLAKSASEKVKVILAGDGSDELLGGYSRYFIHHNPIDIQAGNTHYSSLQQALSSIDHPLLKDQLLTQSFEWYMQMLTCTPEPILSQIYTPEMKQAVYPAKNDYRPLFDANKSQYLSDRFFNIDYYSYFSAELLKKLDVATMGNSIEGRCPFLGTNFAKIVSPLSESQKFQQNQTKYLLKQAMQGHLPQAVINRPKMGFSIPLNQWFRNKLKTTLNDRLSNHHFLAQGWFDKKALATQIDSHIQGQQNLKNMLWTLLTLENLLTQLK